MNTKINISTEWSELSMSSWVFYVQQVFHSRNNGIFWKDAYGNYKCIEDSLYGEKWGLQGYTLFLKFFLQI